MIPAILAAILASAGAPALAEGGSCLSPLHVDGTRLANAEGDTVVLRGVNLGSWLVMETYFTGSAFKDERALWRTLEGRFGPDETKRVREAYRSAWITEADFHRIKALGLNSVRVPFWYGVLEDSGWTWLDKAVAWCESACLYCVIDLHGAPGGQSTADHTGASEENRLWGDAQLQRDTAALWTSVAARYRGRAAVGAYDLLNEPMGAPSAAALASVYDGLVAAVRSADPTTPVIVEDGYRGLADLPSGAARGWTGVMYSEHHYATFGKENPKPEDHEAFMSARYPGVESEQRRLGGPIYIGEWNVIDETAGGAPTVARYVEAMADRGWSWAIWTYKQTRNGGQGVWAFYHNDSPAALPDFERDDLPTILAKIEGLRTENLVQESAQVDGVRPQPKAPAASPLAEISARRLVERALPEGVKL